MRLIFAATVMLAASAALVHAAENPPSGAAPMHNDVADPGQVQVENNALAEMIERENHRLDRQLRSICRGC
jgi:hypothetical protein